ncbi:hypothetical protein [Cytobacillus firmus]|uniref:hypothetical protein n=1 Tax=Cytobacillus firmus TaxID=1399 RepID=UPI0018CEAFF1|nr:hypothetical protein [Cytobacillus firmus]MBG9657103.1 hypothetical protein [Cytobacillus firmus]MED1906779.1 hypothetical protein [Cytobacillus firmus]
MIKTPVKKESKQQIKGYSLKSPRQSEFYIYVWDKNTYDSKKVLEKRKQKGTRNYSKVEGWKSLGNIKNPSSWEKLYVHLYNMYGTVNEQEVKDYLEEKQKELEKKRMDTLHQLNKWIADEYKRMGIENVDWIPDVKKAKKILKELRA